MEPVQLAAILAAVVLLASMLSVELWIAVTLFEPGLGVLVGNVFELRSQEWLDFITAILLTFLAGLEVDPGHFRKRFAASVGIGLVSFSGPFVVGSLVAYLALDRTLKASLIAGTALSTTSLAVIYAVLVEDGLNETELASKRLARAHAHEGAHDPIVAGRATCPIRTPIVSEPHRPSTRAASAQPASNLPVEPWARSSRAR
jgi:Kef-type K+ transport system membrane component KefB